MSSVGTHKTGHGYATHNSPLSTPSQCKLGFSFIRTKNEEARLTCESERPISENSPTNAHLLLSLSLERVDSGANLKTPSASGRARRF
jgi:hypothetical protein